MTIRQKCLFRKGSLPGRQAGVVLMIAVIMLVAMSLTAIALVRSVYTTNIIAGNMTFQQAAVHESDTGIDAAISFLQAQAPATLYNTIYANGAQTAYVAARQDPGANQSWSDFWSDVLEPANVINTMTTNTQTGNTVSYVIHRLCNAPGDPFAGAGCAVKPDMTGSPGNGKGVGVIDLNISTAVYYRITTRVAGPRGTVSFVQAVISLE